MPSISGDSLTVYSRTKMNVISSWVDSMASPPPPPQFSMFSPVTTTTFPFLSCFCLFHTFFLSTPFSVNSVQLFLSLPSSDATPNTASLSLSVFECISLSLAFSNLFSRSLSLISNHLITPIHTYPIYPIRTSAEQLLCGHRQLCVLVPSHLNSIEKGQQAEGVNVGQKD